MKRITIDWVKIKYYQIYQDFEFKLKISEFTFQKCYFNKEIQEEEALGKVIWNEQSKGEDDQDNFYIGKINNLRDYIISYSIFTSYFQDKIILC